LRSPAPRSTAYWNPWFLILIGCSTSVDYVVARRLPRTARPAARRALVAMSISMNLAVLIVFKYSAFLADSARSLAALAGIALVAPTVSLILPLGISFYTFEAISYVVDVYRGRIQPARSLLHYVVFILFFPHLIAGPIVRGHEFLPQLDRRRRASWPRLEAAMRRFLLGLFKKVVFADRIGPIIDPVFASPGAYGTMAVWAALLGYSVQVYCDFSGYSDMAIAIAQAFDIKLPENFNLPYAARNIADYWRRWHMTLTRWLRDYVYIPLGGNRLGAARMYRNIILTFAIVGLWHGAAWHIVVWGVYHGVLVSLHRALSRARPTSPLPDAVAIPCTYLSVIAGYAIFRTPSLQAGAVMLRRLVVPSGGLALAAGDETVVLILVALTLAAHVVGSRVDVDRLAWRLPAYAVGGALAAGVLLVQLLTPAGGPPFIYFQF